VPQDITHAAAEELQVKLKEQLGDRPIIVITHNVTFGRLEKLSPNEAARVIHRIESVIYDKGEDTGICDADGNPIHVGDLEKGTAKLAVVDGPFDPDNPDDVKGLAAEHIDRSYVDKGGTIIEQSGAGEDEGGGDNGSGD